MNVDYRLGVMGGLIVAILAHELTNYGVAIVMAASLILLARILTTGIHD